MGTRTKGHFKENNFKGGIHKVSSPLEVQEVSSKMLGKRFIHPTETDEDGILCSCVYILEELDVDREFFLQIENDLKLQQPVITYSAHGGQSFDRIRDLWPESIHTIPIDVRKGIDIINLMEVASNLNVSSSKQSYLVFLLKNLYECFI
jgi:succinyl-CoA synthetase beta subunit